MTMTQQRNGLLMVLMQPPAALEEEFAAWYDTEHVPERAVLPGFKTALRYVTLSGYPRYMAIYDLDSTAVLDSPGYQAVSGPNFSPWTKRVTSRVQACRIVAEQIFPGDAVTRRSSRLMLIRLRAVGGVPDEEVVAALRGALEGRPETASLRVFKSTENKTADYFCILGMTQDPAEAIDFRQLGALADNVDTVNIYAPYQLLG
jgi:hypothetical protein